MSADLLPLLNMSSPETPIAKYRGRWISAGQFVADAQALATSFPAADYVVNLCENRYHFALAWAAACLRSQLTLLPPNRARGVLDDLAVSYPKQHTLDDERMESFAHVEIEQPSGQTAQSLPDHWRIPAQRVVALTFTSGSTGMPQSHPKTWRTLSVNAQLACEGVLGGAGSQVVATVPAQHVYGLETSLICAFAAGCMVYDGKPFFPQDVRSALADLAGPRTLVTTPTHLKALIDSHVQLPALCRVVSATAPLSVELAQSIEAAWSTEVYEIYGCTEAGVMARRRTAQTQQWETFPGGTVIHTDAGPQYRAPQLPEPVPLQDVIESQNETHFYLRGRAADMIKVAGKRTSLQEITRHLLAVPGVVDAAVFVPQPDARPVAIVVAPTLSPQQILAQLGERIEAVFLPRPLLRVDRLPRNDVGKLPREALMALWSQRQ
jgi:acyl-coenzyme A synthetase/AMP-(fatty) acid ligase